MMADVKIILAKYGNRPCPRFVICRAKHRGAFFVLDRARRRRAVDTPTFETKREGYCYLDSTEVLVDSKRGADPSLSRVALRLS